MELYEMLFSRLATSEALSGLLAVFDERPAVFYQKAASADDTRWNGKTQYPRINYIIDMQENPARNTSGSLTVDVWCDAEHGAEPEDVEKAVRGLLHATFAQTDDELYCFEWTRSEAFEAQSDVSAGRRTIGYTMAFDIMACPCVYAMNPDPIQAVNLWTKAVLPSSVVIGEDTVNGWLVPTQEVPVIYWRLTDIREQQKHFTHTWLYATIEGHVYAPTANQRLHNLLALSNAEALAPHIPMTDGSPLLIDKYETKPTNAYLAHGQIVLSGTFGLLQPDAHFTNKGTGDALNNANKTYIYTE